MIEKVLCEIHGSKEMTFACIHIAMAIDSKEKVGFYYSEVKEDLPQIAWCGECEQWLLDNGEEWTSVFQAKADFKMLCLDCFDEVKNNETEIHIR